MKDKEEFESWLLRVKGEADNWRIYWASEQGQKRPVMAAAAFRASYDVMDRAEQGLKSVAEFK